MKHHIAALLALATISTPAHAAEDGRPLPALPADLVGATRFDGSADCEWTRPGRDPFTGNIDDALVAQGVRSSRTRERLRQRIAAHDADDVIDASRGGVVARRAHTLYVPGIAMTFAAKRICYNTRVFYDGRQSGRLYIEDGFHIWIPDVCGNVSRLLPWWEACEYARSDRPDVVPGIGPRAGLFRRFAYPFLGQGLGERRAQPYTPLPRVEGGVPARDVPEPPVWALLGLGVVAAAFAARRDRG